MRRLVTGGAGCIGADLVHCTWRERPDHSFTVLEADELSWKPRYTDFRDGLAATVEWYRNNELSWRPLEEQVEAKYAARGQ